MDANMRRSRGDVNHLRARPTVLDFAPMRSLVLVLALAPLVACGEGVGTCGNQADITGTWDITATPLVTDGGTASLMNAFTIEANLVQAERIDFLGIGHFVHGTLTASDASVFGTLAIPELRHNSGNKSGAILGCKVGIHVPIAAPVTDDNVEQGPDRVALSGQVTQRGYMESVVVTSAMDDSSVVLTSDPSSTARQFSWTATQR